MTTNLDIRPELLPDRRRGLHDRWHLLHSKSRQEKALSASLRGLGVSHFLPLRRELTFRGGRRGEVFRPVFPGYLFLWGDIEDAYCADRTRRVANLIQVPDQGTLEWELDNLSRALDAADALDPYHALTPGVRARVLDGPFSGLEGTVASRARPDRIELQVRMLGTAVSLDIDGAALELL